MGTRFSRLFGDQSPVTTPAPVSASASVPATTLAQVSPGVIVPSTTQADGAAVQNQNQNANKHAGTGNIINTNYNTTTNHYSKADLQETSKEIQLEIDTALKPWHVPLAVYDTELGSGCMKGTRTTILEAIHNWLHDPTTPPIFWLAGMAGTGKTAIAWTVCSCASADPTIILGGSFFCSRSAGSTEHRDARRVVPTLARLLARQLPEFGAALAKELEHDPYVMAKHVKTQVKQLLYKPLLALKGSISPVLFVIDALDECCSQTSVDGKSDDFDSHRTVSDLLDALAEEFSHSAGSLLAKFLVTSRPETHIRDTCVSNATFSKVLRLHEDDKAQAAADVHLYIEARLLNPQLRGQFTTADALKLSRVCDGLFIAAATALKYILAKCNDTAAERFQTVLNSSRDGLSNGVAEALDAMYALILAEAMRDDGGEANKIPTLPELLASLLSTRMTLSVAALADLLDQPTNDSPHVLPAHTRLRARLSRLHAVIHVPDGDVEPSLRTLHASFGDYLFVRAPDSTRLSESLGHDVLARACFQVMDKRLRFNVSQNHSSYKPNSTTRHHSITLSLEYACLQWAYHLASAPNPSVLHQDIERKFRPRLLFWLEVMSTLGQVRRASAMLAIAAGTIRSTDLVRFLRDASSFVASSQQAIECSAPHIYLSALPFAPKDSLVYKSFMPLCTGLISVEPFGTDRHGGQIIMTLTGHDGDVNAVAYAPDGHRIASGSEDGTVRIWDTRVGEETMSPLRSEKGMVKSVAFAPSGELLAAGTVEGDVCIWSSLDGHATLRRLAGHSAAIYSVAYSPNGTLLASASWDRTVRLWKTEDNELHGTLRGHVGRVHVVTFSPDSNILATGADDSTIRLWRSATCQPVGSPLHGHSGSIFSVAFSRDAKVLASGGRDQEIRLWNVQSGTTIATLEGHSDCVRSVQFSSNGRSLASSADDKNVRIWTLRDNPSKTSVVLEGHTDSVRCVTFSPDDHYITSASADRAIRIWDAGSGRAVVQPLPAHSDTVTEVAVYPDGTAIVSSSTDNTVRVWNASKGEPRFAPLRGHTEWVFSVAISSDGRLIASASKDSTIRLWDAQTGTAIGEPLRGHSADVNTVAFSPCARWLASGSDDKTVRIWDTTTGTPSTLGPFDCDDIIFAVPFSPDGKLLAAGDRLGRIYLWKTETGPQQWEALQAHRDFIHSITFSPASTHIASGGRDNTGRIWDISTRQQVLSLKGHTNWILSIAYSPDGRYIATGSADNTVRLWDAATGATTAELYGHQNWVRSIAFTPHGSIVSSSRDTTIRVWDLKLARPPLLAAPNDVLAALVSSPFVNGWLLGPKGELLLWVPDDYRSYLQVLPCVMVIGKRRVVITAGNGVLHGGDGWTACWRS